MAAALHIQQTSFHFQRGSLMHGSCQIFFKISILRKAYCIPYNISTQQMLWSCHAFSIPSTVSRYEKDLLFSHQGVASSSWQKRRATPCLHSTTAHQSRGVKHLTTSDLMPWKMKEVSFKCWAKAIKITLTSHLFPPCHSYSPLAWVASLADLHPCGAMWNKAASKILGRIC